MIDYFQQLEEIVFTYSSLPNRLDDEHFMNIRFNSLCVRLLKKNHSNLLSIISLRENNLCGFLNKIGSF